jgi:hypothetical protein
VQVSQLAPPYPAAHSHTSVPDLKLQLPCPLQAVSSSQPFTQLPAEHTSAGSWQSAFRTHSTQTWFRQ